VSQTPEDYYFVSKSMKRFGVPILSLLEGGYHLSSALSRKPKATTTKKVEVLHRAPYPLLASSGAQVKSRGVHSSISSEILSGSENEFGAVTTDGGLAKGVLAHVKALTEPSEEENKHR
jgi:hypothetical protein